MLNPLSLSHPWPNPITGMHGRWPTVGELYPNLTSLLILIFCSGKVKACDKKKKKIHYPFMQIFVSVLLTYSLVSDFAFKSMQSTGAEMTTPLLLRTLEALPEHPGSIPSIHIRVYGLLQLQFQGIPCSLQDSTVMRHVCSIQTFRQTCIKIQ